jgi:hypothetical protein
MSSDDVRERVARWLYDYWEEVTGHPPLTVCNPQSRWFDDADELLSLIDRTQAEEIERLSKALGHQHGYLEMAELEIERLRSQEPVAWGITYGGELVGFSANHFAKEQIEFLGPWGTMDLYAAPPDGEEEGDDNG